MKFYVLLISCLMFLSHSLVANATPQATGEATISIKRKKPNKDELVSARDTAVVKALENYLSQRQTDIYLYDDCIRPVVDERINDFISQKSVQDQQVNKDFKELTVWVRVAINQSRLDNHLRKCKGRGERAPIAFVFVTRERQASGDYVIPTTNANVERSVQTVFLNNGFKLLSSMRMETLAGGSYKKSRMLNDYVNDGAVNWSPANNAALTLGSDFLVAGAFDVQPPVFDKSVQLYRARVEITGELVELETESILAIESDIQGEGEATTPEEAILDARKNAAEVLARTMVSQLNAQRIR